MNTPSSPGETYRAARPYLDSALETYREAVDTGLQSELTDYYVSGRVKAARSLIRKMRKEPGNPRSWESIKDKVGLRIVCSTKTDVARADKWLQHSNWNVLERTVMKKGYDQLFYPGTHFIVEDESLLDHAGAPIPCEIQIRTRAQDAWSVVSHKLLYKGLITPPNKMKRVITRLTVVVEMFDDEVQRMMKRRRRLDAYRPALMLEALDQQYERLTGEPSGGLPDLDLMLTLMNSYGPDEIGVFEHLMEVYCTTNKATLETLLNEHQPAAETYNDSRDWLYTQPEILTVLERMETKPWLLLDAVRDTDLEDVVRRSCVAAGHPLPDL